LDVNVLSINGSVLIYGNVTILTGGNIFLSGVLSVNGCLFLDGKITLSQKIIDIIKISPTKSYLIINTTCLSINSTEVVGESGCGTYSFVKQLDGLVVFYSGECQSSLSTLVTGLIAGAVALVAIIVVVVLVLIFSEKIFPYRSRPFFIVRELV